MCGPLGKLSLKGAWTNQIDRSCSRSNRQRNVASFVGLWQLLKIVFNLSTLGIQLALRLPAKHYLLEKNSIVFAIQ